MPWWGSFEVILFLLIFFHYSLLLTMLLYITHISCYLLLSRARDLQNPAAWTVPEAPGEAFSYWQRSVQPERREPRSEPEPEQPEGPERPGRVCNEP